MSTGPSIVLAGGGSAGHVNPLLATADALRRRRSDVTITVLGTSEGLESTLVPARGYELAVIPKVPFPRRPGRQALAFPGGMRAALRGVTELLDRVGADVLVGFGGYVAAPAYLAARKAKVPIVIHEQNARPGMANRLGARFTTRVAVSFEGTPLAHARLVGLPLRAEITGLDRSAARPDAVEHFGLEPERSTLLVFGGSLGAARLNAAVAGAATALGDAGVQVLHLTGAGKDIGLPDDLQVPYRALPYTDRMDLALAVADLAVCRAGAGTVAELCAVGVPAAYVPLPIGNGEQRLNAAGVVAAGGGLMVDDADLTTRWVLDEVIPLITDTDRLTTMADQAAVMGVRDADDAMAQLILATAGAADQEG